MIRNFGILFAYIAFNVFIAVLTYWLFRVANFGSLKSKLHRTKKGAKTKQGADKAVGGATTVAKNGGHAPSGMEKGVDEGGNVH